MRLLTNVRADYGQFVDLVAHSEDRAEAAARLSTLYGCPIALATTLLNQQFFQLIGAVKERPEDL